MGLAIKSTATMAENDDGPTPYNWRMYSSFHWDQRRYNYRVLVRMNRLGHQLLMAYCSYG